MVTPLHRSRVRVKATKTGPHNDTLSNHGNHEVNNMYQQQKPYINSMKVPRNFKKNNIIGRMDSIQIVFHQGAVFP